MPFFSKSFRIKTAQKEMIEPEEIIIDSAMTPVDEDYFFAARRKFEVPVTSFVFWLIFIFVAGVLVLLFARVAYLQIIEHGAFAAQLDRNFRRTYPIQSFRGVLYDKNFEQLAENIPSFALVFDTKDFIENPENFTDTIEMVTRILDVEKEALEERIREAKDFSRVILIPNLSHEQILEISPHLDAIPRISVEERYARHYKDGSMEAHLTGYVGRVSKEDLSQFGDFYRDIDYIGKDGLEAQYEEVLRGDFGVEVREQDARGRIRKKFVEKAPLPGKSLLLHVDSEFQRYAFETIQKKLREMGLKKAAFVAIDPRSGGVLSLISFPSFDPNSFVSGVSKKEYESLFLGKEQPLFNRAISGTYPPGSTIKPLIASAALQNGVIGSSKRLYAPEAIYVQHPYREDVIYSFVDWKFHGWISILEAIAESSNTFFYQIGGGFENQKGLGIAKIKEYLFHYGWGRLLGIDIPGEKEGLIPDPEWKKKYKDEIWYIGDTYNASIGQGDVSVTPLQLASAIAVVANGGILYQPQIVDKIVAETKEVVEDFSPKIIDRDFIDPKILETVKEGMYRVTRPGGTAVRLSQLPQKVGAKTGTAQPGKAAAPHSWITVIAPLENPELVIAVLIENGGGETASPVTPVAYEILDWYFKNKTENHEL